MKKFAVVLIGSALLLSGCFTYSRTVETSHLDPLTGQWVTDSKHVSHFP